MTLEVTVSADKRLTYANPKLKSFGSVAVLTKAGSNNTMDEVNATVCPNVNRNRPCPSDIRLKRDIVRLGVHACGVGLYVYRYVQDLVPGLPRGWHFGVMAGELASIMPEAVVRSEGGYLAVNYEALR
jgi:hypothetical protein